MNKREMKKYAYSFAGQLLLSDVGAGFGFDWAKNEKDLSRLHVALIEIANALIQRGGEDTYRQIKEG